MPSYLDFESSRAGNGLIGPIRTGFRDYVLSKTLKVPNGPQTYTKTDYRFATLSDFPNIDQGDVVKNDAFNRNDQLIKTAGLNRFKDTEYYVVEDLRNVILNNGLKLYPYFPTNVPNYNLIGIMGSNGYQTESELFKFAADYIKNNTNGPVYQRIKQNTERLTTGRLRLLDALNGNTNTAINLLTGRESLVELNNSITVAKTIPGKAIDFLENSVGIEIPFSQIPGDYLSNPYRPNQNTRPQASTEVGKLLQDVTGVLGSMIGIERRPTETRKPSDLLIEYMGQGQKQRLFEALSFSKYAPNYTTTARSQNTSKIFNYVEQAAQGVKDFLGLEAPAGMAYIGDDRGNDVKFAVNDFNDRPVRSSYYLSLLFDSVAAELFHKPSTMLYGGFVGGQLTWSSKNSKNKLGANNTEYSSQEQSKLENSLSTNYQFREDSLLGYTQQILDSLPSDAGAARSHVANVIDQTSRVFMDGDTKISRGSAIKYTDKYSNDEAGVEYCRVWTKDRPYLNYSDTMKRTSNIRKFDSSVLGGDSRVWNLNIAPISNGGRGSSEDEEFRGSTNIVKGANGFYAKKYMFSIENLAWKTSDIEGFRVIDLPVSERGPNGGRVMWFPPYDLKVSEQNNARWEENNFLGRPEPIYTYQNTSRTGQISFKVVVDHPSIINLLVGDFFKNMSDEEADNYIMSVFSGCEDLDFYELVTKYSNLKPSEIKLVETYLNNKKTDSDSIERIKYTANVPVEEIPVTPEESSTDNSGGPVSLDVKLFFANDFPKLIKGQELISKQTYKELYDVYKTKESGFINDLNQDLTDILTGSLSGKTGENDRNVIVGKPNPMGGLSGAEITTTKNQIISVLTGKTSYGFNSMNTGYTAFDSQITTLKTDVINGEVNEVTLTLLTAASEVGDESRNFYLGIRRAHSIYRDFISKFSNGKTVDTEKSWFDVKMLDQFKEDGMLVPIETTFDFKVFGYETNGVLKVRVKTNGENSTVSAIEDNLNCNQKIKAKNGLKITAPIAFYCRQGQVKLEYTKVPKKQDEEKVIEVENLEKPKRITTIERTRPGQTPKPTINMMQSIIMKILSESYYFKKLEETDPFVFNSLREKLRYFHPGFHSTTPEGLNSRLTFLLQCVRPGDTIPIKGLNSDVNSIGRNTSFGPPPICVLRVGDFYHSKIAISDVNIGFEENVWDLNPEGIGVQPMIANVTLQIKFLGGQGLEKPVERLQNALSSNFYGNTEMYDERAKITSTINNKRAEDFTKEFLEKLSEKYKPERTAKNDSSKSFEVSQGTYIGIKLNSNLFYDQLIEGDGGIFKKIENYHNSYKVAVNEILKKYGEKMASLFFSSTYRTIKDLSIDGGTISTVELLGQYPLSKDLSYLSTSFKETVKTAIQSNNCTQLMELDEAFPEKLVSNSENVLKPYLTDLVTKTIDSFVDIKSIKDVESSRNELITIVDKLNYLVQYQHDAKINDVTFTATALTGFVDEDFYNVYKKGIEFLEKCNQEFVSTLDNSINFNNTTINSSTLSEILSIFLKDVKWSEFSSIYSDPLFDNYKTKMNKKYSQFVDVKLKEHKFKDRKYPISKGTTILTYIAGSDSEITDGVEKDVLVKINGSFNKLGNTLNYYKP